MEAHLPTKRQCNTAILAQDIAGVINCLQLVLDLACLGFELQISCIRSRAVLFRHVKITASEAPIKPMVKLFN